MHRRKKTCLFALLAATGILLVFIMITAIFFPSVFRQAGYWMDLGITRVRGVLLPVGALPTAPLSTPAATLTPSPTSTPLPTSLPSPTPTRSPTPLPSSVSLPPPPYEAQDWNNCGPVTLSMYLHYYGWAGDQYDISDILKPERGDRNVNVEELAGYVRTQVGWLGIIYRVGGDTHILRRLLAAGFPVMIEEAFTLPEGADGVNGPADDRWTGHYLLLTGYNDTGGYFTTHDSFVGANRQVPYASLDANWQAFNRVYIIVYPPAQEGTLISLLGSDWDEAANRQHALDAATAETATDPGNTFAWFNLGSNLVYFERYDEAAAAFDTARNLVWPQRMLRYQFGPFWAYFHSGRIEDLMAVTAYALRVTPNSEEALLWQGWGYYRQGNKIQAMRNFNEALLYHPGYPDALYAIEFVQNN